MNGIFKRCFFDADEKSTSLPYGAQCRLEIARVLATYLKWVFDLFPILRDRKDQKGGLLSGGEQQMLALGRALKSSPELIMLDEPSLNQNLPFLDENLS